MTGRRSLGIGKIALLGLMRAWLGPAAEVEPQLVYVGARICGECHAGPGVNYQYSKWLNSKHSQAYAALAQPEARRIARLSGVREDPQRAFACLGCHTTAAHAEQWQRDETYRIEDGVQCETCHGPGSAHVEEYRRPGPHSKERGRMEVPRKEQLCISCHGAKGSHVAVLKTPAFDLEKAWREVAHPVPEHPKGGSIPTVSAAERNQRAGPKFVGSYTCGKCHRGPEFGYQYSRWRRSAHARAWAVLATEKALQMARAMGVEEDPQRAARCLKCHTTAGAEPPEMLAASYEIDEGVGCEACHGPGSEYMAEAIMRDRRAARQHGLRVVSKETCQSCHENAHGRPFRVDLSAVAHPSKLAQDTVEEVRYKTPWNLAFRPNSTELWVTCSGSDTVAIVDWRSREKLAEVAVGAQPFAISFSPDGRWAYVTNLFEDTISVIDASARQQTGKIAVGDEPHGIYATPDGRRVLVANAMSEDVTVLLASSGKLEREKTLAASRRAWWLAASPDGERIILTHALPYLVPFRTPSVAEVTVIAADRAVVEDRIRVEGANLLLGAAWHPSGEYALTTLNRTKNLVPMTRLLQGWTITNGLAVVWRNGEVDQVLLDEPGMCFPDPTGLAVTPDGRYALVTSSGSDRVAVVDLDRLTAIIRHATPYERRHVLPNHLGKPVEFVVAHIPTGKSPRGIVVSPEGRLAFVAEALDDAIAVIDLHERRVVSRIDLGGPRQITKERWGEQLFHSARNTFQRQFSCHTCHPDGHVDGITYDIEPDGIGVSPVDNRSLRGVLDTAPFKWEGTNPNLQRQCGARLAAFFTRIQPFTPEELEALELYIASIPRPPNPFRPLGADYTPAQRRGKAIFERTRTNDGRIIPPGNRCITCHPPPLYTDRQRHDVGTRHELDRDGRFDTPHLTNVYDSAPYLHNGIALSLEEIWTVHNPYDTHGVTNDLTKDQLNDLIEFLKTL